MVQNNLRTRQAGKNVSLKCPINLIIKGVVLPIELQLFVGIAKCLYNLLCKCRILLSLEEVMGIYRIAGIFRGVYISRIW